MSWIFLFLFSFRCAFIQVCPEGKMPYLHVHMHTLGVRRLVCGSLPWQLCPYLCCCQLDSLLYDVDTFSLIVHRGIFSEHFCVIELLGNSAHEVEVAQSDMPAMMWTT